MKHPRIFSTALAPILILVAAGPAAAQVGGQYGYPGPGSGYYGSSFAGPGYQGPGATGAGYIGPGGSPFQATPRPIMSPYMNFFRGTSPSANYFLGTVPSLQQQQQSTRYILPDVGALRQPSPETDEFIPQIAPTGHMVQYMSYGPFYGQLNRGPRSTMLTPYSNIPPRKR